MGHGKREQGKREQGKREQGVGNGAMETERTPGSSLPRLARLPA